MTGCVNLMSNKKAWPGLVRQIPSFRTQKIPWIEKVKLFVVIYIKSIWYNKNKCATKGITFNILLIMRLLSS